MRTVTGSSRALALAVVAMALAACGEAQPEVDRSPVTLRIHGDSLVRMVERDAEAGGTVECPATFRAEIEGPEGAQAILRGGRIDYWWWTTGGQAGTYEWSQEAVRQLWADTLLPVGQPRISHTQGFGQSSPAQPVRAQVVFDYSATNTDEVRQTEPYRFYCF
jgi:hypothetical protein